MKVKKTSLFILFVFVLGVLTFFTTFSLGLRKKSISSDAQGYYAYLPAFLLYKDFSMEKVFLYHPEAESLQFPAVYKNEETGRNMPKYPMGEVLFLLPFFLFAHIFSLLLGFPATGYSILYQQLVGMAGVFYLILGLYFLGKLYRIFFKEKTVLLTLLVLTFATNLFHYASFTSLMSHVYSFSLISIFLYLLFKSRKEFSLKNSLLLGFLGGLIFLVRNINVLYLFLILPYLKDFLKKDVKKIFYLGFAFLLTVLPQFLYWQYAAGHFFYYSYRGEGFNFLDPRIKGFLTSFRRGLFFWSPVFLFCFPGFYKLKKRLGRFFYGMVLVLVLLFYFYSSWSQWAYGGGFGNRVLIDLYPLLGLMLANFYEFLGRKKSLKFLVYGLSLFFIVLNLTNMIKYWQGIIPPDHVTLKIYLDSFFILKR